jgi:adenylate cyclase
VDPDAVERKLAAILSADVVGYSRLTAEDEEGTVRALKGHRLLIDELVRAHRGRVFGSAGDSVVAEFSSPVEAARCAVEIQQKVADSNAGLPDDRRMRFRVGVNLGDVVVEGENLLGDGVNIAARLEALADPDGICISGTIYDQIRRKLDLGYDDLGEQSVKNIPEPVRVYRIQLKPEGTAATEALPGMAELTVPGFSGRPAIAVLPFDNLSGDPEQEYFADGIVEDLITRLSGWRWFPVIARNSSFVYKGKAVDVKRVSRELGVRYIIEGSVRKAGNRVRVAAQLIDAPTNHHVWAEHYDRELRDIFALQDEIIETIVESIEPRIRDYEPERAIRQNPRNLDAWDCAQRAWWQANKLTKDDNARARLLFERAIELDPQFVLPFFGLVMTHYFDIIYQWTDSPGESLREIVRAAPKSVALDDKDPFGHLALGLAHFMTGRRDEAISAYELAVQCNPSASMAYVALGAGLALAGRPDDGIEKLEQAMRLSPHDPQKWMYFNNMGLAQFAAERYEEAVVWAQRSLQSRLDYPQTHRLLAVSYAHLDRLDEARAAFEGSVRLQPGFSLAVLKLTLAAADPDFVERYSDGLRKAGLKE